MHSLKDVLIFQKETYFWETVFWENDLLGKLPSGKLSLWETSSWEITSGKLSSTFLILCSAFATFTSSFFKTFL